MKCKFYKIWLLIIAILIVGFYVAYPFVSLSTLKEPRSGEGGAYLNDAQALAMQWPDNETAKPDKKKLQKKVREIHPRSVTQPSLAQSSSWLNKISALWRISERDQLRAAVIPLVIFLILMTLLAIGSRLVYQRRTRFRIYQGYKALYQTRHQLHSVDLAVIDQGIATLTGLFEALVKDISVRPSQLPVLYSLCAHIDYNVNRLQEKKLILGTDPIRLANLPPPPVIMAADMTTEQKSLMASEIADKVIAKLQYRPAPSTRSISKFASVIAWKKQAYDQKPLEAQERLPESAEPIESEAIEDTQPITEPEQQPVLTTAPEARPLLEIAEDGLQIEKPEARPNIFARSASKFSSITFWKKVPEDTLAEQHPLFRTEAKPELAKTVDEGALVTTEQQANFLSQSINTFVTLPFWKKKKQADTTTIELREEAPSMVIPSEPEPALQATEAADDIKRKHAQSIIQKHILAGMAFSAVPVPMLDVAALTSTQLNLLHSLSVHYGVEFDKDKSKSIVIALLGGSLPTTAVMWLSSLTKMMPGIGTLSGGASLSVTAGAVIYATGQAFIKHFEAGGEAQDFDGKQQRAFFQRALKESLASTSKK